MQISFLNVSLLSILGFGLLTCSEPNKNESEYFGIVEFTIETDTSSIHQDPDWYTIRMRTGQSFSSVPNYIVYDLDKTENQYLFHTLRIDSSESDNHGLGPATAKEDLLLYDNVTYDLLFKNNIITDLYRFHLVGGELEFLSVVSNFSFYRQNDDGNWD